MESEISFDVYSPVQGIIKNLKDIAYKAFAQGCLGPGLAIEPSEGCVKAPFDGKIKTLNKSQHTLVIENSGLEVLIHIGADRASLKGKGFKAFCTERQEVKKGQLLIEFDKDFIAKNTAGNLVIVLVCGPQAAEFSLAKKGSAVKYGDLIFSVNGMQSAEDIAVASESLAADCGSLITKEVVISSANGLHSRPAAAIAKAANMFRTEQIFIFKNSKKANAKSLVEILGLNVNFRDKVEFSAQGPQAEQALKAVLEATESYGQNTQYSDDTNVPVPDFSKEVSFKGSSLYPGLVIGRGAVLKRQKMVIEEYAGDIARESDKLQKALSSVKDKIEADIISCKDNNRREILKAHLVMAGDPFLKEYSARLVAQGKTAAFAWNSAVEESIKILDGTSNKLLKERKADYKDIGTRVLVEITGCNVQDFNFPPDTILITDELLPGELSRLEGKISGLIMANGSQTSHIAIMLKNMGLTSLICAGPAVLLIPEGANIVLDSTKNIVKVNPADLEAYRRESKEVNAMRVKASETAFEPAITKDGVLIEVKGNAGSLQDAVKAQQSGADGIGLLRSEFLFSSYRREPCEEEQFEIYSEIAASQKGKDIIVRTFDTGGDKPLPFFPLPKEDNPIAGLRGIRNYSLEPDLFRRQVRAIMRVKPYGTAKIMLPMAGFIEEIRQYRDIIKREQASLGIDKVYIGMMVEVPSAALMADIFAGYVDFMSLGTNDLTQYALAIDRGNTYLNKFSDTLCPAVLKLIYNTAQACKKAKIPLGVCGAVAGDIQAVPLLIGLGIGSLSVPGGLTAEIKYLIRNLDISFCGDLAVKCLNMQSALEVRNTVRNVLNL